MTARLLLATRNRKKLAELHRILAPEMPVEVLGLDDLPAFDEVPESGATFGENALIKALEAVRQTGLVTVADDSGLAVDALNGMPGVLSARWAGSGRDDTANLNLVLEQLSDTPDERLGAAFVCAAALVTPDGSQVVREGRMPGRLIRRPRGANGFGYDPIFVPEGYQLTSAELDAADKDAISHRGRALRELLPFILRALEGPEEPERSETSEGSAATAGE
ncbi:MAG: RdgB/HAM1 family non-canonical purine NTP pyrophosphatase [Actinobacteria bacterium]|nr:RdgB/HAM1 family non-canonical purine NTP pyrophosphatase [Actinomycetota bacterium]